MGAGFIGQGNGGDRRRLVAAGRSCENAIADVVPHRSTEMGAVSQGSVESGRVAKRLIAA